MASTVVDQNAHPNRLTIVDKLFEPILKNKISRFYPTVDFNHNILILLTCLFDLQKASICSEKFHS